MGEYVHKLAVYSAELFGGAAAYYDANAKIEDAVLGTVTIGSAIESLRICEGLLEACRTDISPVASLWGMVAPGEPVDFVSQDSHLGSAIVAVRNARCELEHLHVDNDTVQAAIWARPSLTDELVAASGALSDAVAWQTRFATVSSASLALVA